MIKRLQETGRLNKVRKKNYQADHSMRDATGQGGEGGNRKELRGCDDGSRVLWCQDNYGDYT